MSGKLPEFRPGNPEIFWYIRDHCDWPMTAKVMYEAMYKRWGGRDLFPSDSLLAKDTSSSTATVKRWRKWLRTHGLLEWETDKNGTTNNYRLLPPWSYLAQNDLGQNDPGSERDLGQDNLGQNDLGHSDRGDLGQIELRRLKGEEEKGKREDIAAAVFKTSHVAETYRTEDLLRGGCGGRLPEWADSGECYRAVRMVLAELNAAGLADEPPGQADAAGRPYAVVVQRFLPLAREKGKTLEWWIHRAGIAAFLRESWFDASTMEADLQRIAAGEEIAPADVPEWATLANYRDALGPAWVWTQGGVDTAFWSSLGVRIVTESGEMWGLMRWGRVYHVAFAATADGPLMDLLLQAEEAGAVVLDDPAGRRFTLKGVPAELERSISSHQRDLNEYLARAYQMPHHMGNWMHPQTYEARLYRTRLVQALEDGNLPTLELLVSRDQGFAAHLSHRRGWADRYPFAAPLLRAVEAAHL